MVHYPLETGVMGSGILEILVKNCGVAGDEYVFRDPTHSSQVGGSDYHL
jgi:hypothetical protein